MNKLIFYLTILFLPITLMGQEVPKTLPMQDHPRILLMKGEEKSIQENISSDQKWEKLHQAILREADNLIHEDFLERIQIGRRLLSVSREALRRIFHLSYAYRLTHEDKYLKRAEQEMLTVSKFSDWNPSHFLDVAEMTMAVAIGYDWLFEGLSSSSKQTIKEAIINLGIKPSYDDQYNWFLTATHNWNQVCNAGMVYGALAIYEEEPELAHETIQRAVETIALAMEDYQPDGAYPEGYGYWAYGTTFNVLFLDAIERVYGTDFGLNEVPGFLETGGFFKNMSGVTGYSFNWGDAGGGRGSITPAMYWFAERNQEPSLLWMEKGHFEADDLSRFTSNRGLPATMIWGRKQNIEQIPVPERKAWVGQGANPVALMRTSWTDPNAIYLGFKAGSASVNHGHMDIGSFIMEANGVRWAIDLGSQNYESLESKGIALFGRTQDAQRWTVFRLNNFVHNTLTFDGELQRVDGYAKIDKHGTDDDFSYALSDLSTVYENQVRAFHRGVAIVDQSYVLVKDEIKNKSGQTKMRWNMTTTADVEIKEDGALLTKEGKTLMLKLKGIDNVTWKTYSTTPTTDYDAPNPGTIRVGFEYEAKPDEELSYEVYLLPEGTNMPSEVKKALNQW